MEWLKKVLISIGWCTVAYLAFLGLRHLGRSDRYPEVYSDRIIPLLEAELQENKSLKPEERKVYLAAYKRRNLLGWEREADSDISKEQFILKEKLYYDTPSNKKKVRAIIETLTELEKTGTSIDIERVGIEDLLRSYEARQYRLSEPTAKRVESTQEYRMLTGREYRPPSGSRK